MQLRTQRKNSVTLIQPNGALDMETHLVLKKKVRQLADEGCVRILIDMSGLAGIDSTGIGTLVALLNTVRARGGDICLAGDICPAVLDILRLCGLTSVFRVYNNVETGLQNFSE
ncbi:MAG: STAS domain-containing protein [bacterium]